MGRRSQFTARQRAEVVLAVLRKKTTVAEVCRQHGITEVTFNRWREQALAGMEKGLEPKQAGTSRERELEREIDDLERQLGRMTRIADLRGKFLGRLK